MRDFLKQMIAEKEGHFHKVAGCWKFLYLKLGEGRLKNTVKQVNLKFKFITVIIILLSLLISNQNITKLINQVISITEVCKLLLFHVKDIFLDSFFIDKILHKISEIINLKYL